jgi:hypothetical protein
MLFCDQLGYTSAPGEGGIMRQHDYDRQFSSHTVSIVVGH